MDFALLHVKFDIGLSASVSRNKATLYKKGELKTREVSKRLQLQTPTGRSVKIRSVNKPGMKKEGNEED